MNFDELELSLIFLIVNYIVKSYCCSIIQFISVHKSTQFVPALRKGCFQIGEMESAFIFPTTVHLSSFLVDATEIYVR